MEFIHQLRNHHKDKNIVIIADNVSYHKSKKVKRLLQKYPRVKLDYLPTYSPEYNPVEQIWGWLKPLVHGVKTVKDGMSEILSRIRKIVWHWKNDRIPNSLDVGIGIWNDLVTSIYGE